jgi:1,4-dihydroxy-2-naphthoate octaprenyltransferase
MGWPVKIFIIFKTLRPSFLVLTPVCVFLGLSILSLKNFEIDYFAIVLILVGAISAHISVNTLNEYFDFRSGLDLITDKTKFSGGSGALPTNPEMANVIFIVGIVSLFLTLIIGIYFSVTRGVLILPIGVVGIVLIVTYTQWLNRNPLLCLLAPGLGFGFLIVVGTYVILTGHYSILVWSVSLVPFFLINNLLLLNQYPDIRADASVGRNTFPIAYGLSKSNIVYAFFMVSAYAVIIILILNNNLPKLSYIALAPLLLSLYSLSGAIKHASKIGQYPEYLAINVAATILTPLLLGISIIVG